jgi:hypothetical protein
MACANMCFLLLGDAAKVFDLINIIMVRSKAYAQSVVSNIRGESFKLYHIVITIPH